MTAKLRFFLSPFLLAASAVAMAAPPASMTPGAQVAADRGCYNCHGAVPHKDVPAFKDLVKKWERYGGKPDDGAVNHGIEEMREQKVLVHQLLSADEAKVVVRWLMQGAPQQ